MLLDRVFVVWVRANRGGFFFGYLRTLPSPIPIGSRGNFHHLPHYDVVVVS